MHIRSIDNTSNNCVILCIRGAFMRTTLDLPENLIKEAMALTHIQTKTDVIKVALQNLIQKEKLQNLKNYFGKVELDIDLNKLRDR